MVQLELDRKTLFLSLVGLCVAAVLVFVAGMVVAINWYLPAYATSIDAYPSETAPETETVTRAMRPPTNADAEAEAVSAPPPAAMPRGTRGTVPRAPNVRGTVPRTPNIRIPRAPAPRAPRLGASGPRIAGQLASTDDTGAAAIPVYDEELAFYSVQVGAFASEFNMQSLMLELQDRGYQPYVVTVAINRQILHTVRIGEYGSREEAVVAATRFFEREGMAAVVREVVSSLG